MKIECIYSGEDYDARMTIKIDGKRVFSVYNMGECPEDANLMRDLNFVYDIPDLIEKAYNAGKNGEEIVFISKEE